MLYQQLFEKAKSLIKADICMKFYDDTKPFYLETDASGVGFATVVQQHNMPKGQGVRKHNPSSYCFC